mmetsp:Transcript_6471/g.26666  ORF Transcript_6471/g.26666 Transcript_6471/m.26666 type:complete len:226 (+) Transcript_6471:2180-2857(+)
MPAARSGRASASVVLQAMAPRSTRRPARADVIALVVEPIMKASLAFTASGKPTWRTPAALSSRSLAPRCPSTTPARPLRTALSAACCTRASAPCAALPPPQAVSAAKAVTAARRGACNGIGRGIGGDATHCSRPTPTLPKDRSLPRKDQRSCVQMRGQAVGRAQPWRRIRCSSSSCASPRPSDQSWRPFSVSVTSRSSRRTPALASSAARAAKKAALVWAGRVPA